MSDGSLAQLVQAGGLALFAAAVWYELKQQRTERANTQLAFTEKLTELSATLIALNTSVEVMLDRLDRRKTPPHALIRRPGEVPIVAPHDDDERSVKVRR